MAFGKDSSFVFFMQDGKLVNIGRSANTADKLPFDAIEEEVWRIFGEHKDLQTYCDYLEDLIEEVREEAAEVKLNFKSDADLQAENAKLKEGKLTEKETRIARQALKIWHGDYPQTNCKPSQLWQKEIGQIIDKLTEALKGQS